MTQIEIDKINKTVHNSKKKKNCRIMIFYSPYIYSANFVAKFRWESGFLRGVPWTTLGTNGIKSRPYLGHDKQNWNDIMSSNRNDFLYLSVSIWYGMMIKNQVVTPWPLKLGKKVWFGIFQPLSCLQANTLWLTGCFCRKKVEHGLSFPEFKNRVAVKPARFHRAQYSN